MIVFERGSEKKGYKHPLPGDYPFLTILPSIGRFVFRATDNDSAVTSVTLVAVSTVHGLTLLHPLIAHHSFRGLLLSPNVLLTDRP